MPVPDETALTTAPASTGDDPGSGAPQRIERRFARLADANVVGLVCWDVAGAIIEANDCFLDMIGHARAELDAGRLDWRRLTPADHAALDRAMVELLRTRGSHPPYEKELLHADGTRIPVLVTAVVFEEPSSRGLSLVVDQRPLKAAETERQAALAAERVARASTERLQAVTAALSSAHTPAAVVDVVIAQGLGATRAGAGAVAEIVHDDDDDDEALPTGETRATGARLRFVQGHGYAPALLERFGDLPLDIATPATDAARTGAPVWLGNPAEADARYPALGLPRLDTRFHAWAALPLVVDGRSFGTIALSFAEPRPFADDERAFLEALARQCAQALARARLAEAERAARRAAEAEQRRSAFLVRAGELLASSLDYEQTLQAVARAAVPELGDWCAIDMRTDLADVPTGFESPPAPWPPTVARLAVMHQDPARIAWARELERRMPPDWAAPSGLPRALREAVTEFYPVITDELLVASARDEAELAILREIDFHAYCCVPLIVRGRAVGAITLVMADSHRRYEEADRTLAEELARRAALAIEHALLYREAREANRVKSEFLATMSHELRTPLNAIAGYADLLLLGVHGPVTDGQQEALGRIRRSQQHLLGLINEVLNYARLEAAAVRYEIVPVPLPRLVADVEPLVLPQMRARGLTLDIAACDDVPPVLADAEKTRQILLNLLSNATKFTPAGGRITIRCRTTGTAAGQAPLVQLAVTDTGIGIAPDHLERIFEPFVQVGRALSTPGEGTGLGLAISRDLARGMGGDLTATSVPGEGSTFVLTLRGETG